MSYRVGSSCPRLILVRIRAYYPVGQLTEQHLRGLRRAAAPNHIMIRRSRHEDGGAVARLWRAHGCGGSCLGLSTLDAMPRTVRRTGSTGTSSSTSRNRRGISPLAAHPDGGQPMESVYFPIWSGRAGQFSSVALPLLPAPVQFWREMCREQRHRYFWVVAVSHMLSTPPRAAEGVRKHFAGASQHASYPSFVPEN